MSSLKEAEMNEIFLVTAAISLGNAFISLEISSQNEDQASLLFS